MPVSTPGEPKHEAHDRPTARPDHATPKSAGPVAHDPLATELVARTDELYSLVEPAAALEKRVREAARAVFRGVTRESAAELVNALSVQRASVGAAEALEQADAAARAWLAAHGLVASEAPEHLDIVARAHPSPRGTIIEVLAPAWTTAAGVVAVRGEAVASSGPGSPLLRALDRAERAARRLARRAEDVTARFVDLRADAARLEGTAAVKRAIEAFRYLESLAAIHSAPGIDVAESGLADLAVFLEEKGVHREPRERLEGTPDEPGATETDHLRVRWVEDAAPAGTVIRRIKSAFVQKSSLLDGEKGEVVASLGQRSEAERRLLELARTLEPGSPLTRALVRFRKLSSRASAAAPGDHEAAARVLIELLADLRTPPGASDRTKRSQADLSGGVERLLASLGAERFEAAELDPHATEVAAREPDARPEGTLTRTLEPGWRLRGAILVKARVAVSTGPRSALPALLEGALARPLPAEVRALVAAARARSAGLTLEAAEGEPGLACSLDLACALPLAGDDATRALRAELDAYLAARGLVAFPQDPAQARADLERSPHHYEVELERSERPRGEVVAILGRGYRSRAEVLRKARIATSHGTGDPLARALVSLGDALGPTPVPELSPLSRLAAIAHALEAPTVRGRAGATTQAMTKDPLGEAASAARAAELLAGSKPDVTRAVREVLERALAPALAACGVETIPPFGAEALAPSAAELVDADFEDSDRPPGALLAVAKRGYVRAGQGDRGAVIARAHVVISRGPRPALLDVAEKIARQKGALADLAVELVRKVDASRAELALGRTTESRARDQVLDAGVLLLRAAERAAEDTGSLRSALALLHEQVEVFPTDLAGLDGAELANDPAYDTETVFDDRAPPGTVVRLERAGVRDRRSGVARLERARVVVSVGRRPAIDHALDALVAALREDPLAPTGVEEKIRSVRDAARGLVKDRGSPLEGRLREVLASSFAALLDLIESRAPAVLDEEVLPALRALGVKSAPEADERLERSTPRIEVTRDHSDTVAEGELLRRTRRGLEVDGKVLRVARVVVSLGRKEDTEVAADELEHLLPRLPQPAREPIARAVRGERSTATAVREGKTMPPALSRATLLVDAVNEALALVPETDRGLLLAVRPALGRALARVGHELFPLADSIDAALLGDPQAVEIESADYAGGVRGSVVAVARLGVRRGAAVSRPCRVRLDLGPRPTYVPDLEAAARAGAATEPLVAKLRDPRSALGDEALAVAVFELLAATPAAREPLERALRALGAEVFPRPGETAADGVEVVPVYADDQPAGAIVRVAASGLRRGARVIRAAKAEVSRGPMSQALKALAALAATSPAATASLEALRRKLEALPSERHPSEEGDRILVEALGVASAPEVIAYLRERGYVVAPDAPGGSIETLRTILGGDHALEAPRRRFGNAAAGDVIAVDRPAVVKGDLVLAKARVVVSAGAASEVHTLIQEVRDKLGAEAADPKSLAEVDEILDKAADAKPDRMHFLVFPIMNVLHRLGSKDKHGAGLKAFLRAKNIREITAYAGYPAAELGPKKLEEVRVSSERDKGKIVKVLRPGFEEEKSGAVLQKVQAEVSR